MTLDLVVKSLAGLGGAETYSRQLVAGLESSGVGLRVICERGPEAPLTTGAVLVTGPVRIDRPFAWRVSSLVEWLGARASLDAVAPSVPPDVVVVSSAMLGFWYVRLWRDVPMIYLPHSLVAPLEVSAYRWATLSQQRTAQVVWHLLERHALRRALVTIRFTEHARQALVRHYGRTMTTRIQVLSAPVPLPPDPVPRDEWAPIRLLSVGRLVASKNLDLAITAVAAIPRHVDWHWDIVGDGEQRDHLERRLREAGLYDRVRFHGWQADPSPFYRTANLLLFPSRLESAGLVVLEASSHGVPALVVDSRAPGYDTAAAELVRPEVDGFVATDEADFVRRTVALVQGRRALADAGVAGRRRVVAEHAWSAHIDRWSHLLRHVRAAGQPR